MVYDAWKEVQSNKGSAGIDAISIKMFKEDVSNNLYKLWNRLTSGSYFPQAVKQVGIPKASGGVRYLGIPTVSDRIAQMVVKTSLEQRIDKLFSENSFGYRPGKSAHNALEKAVDNCRKYDWVIDLDIKGFFDNIDHVLLEKALERHANKWEIMYIKRWLEAPIQKVDGTIEKKQGKGTPQGGVISPLLANLFLHYTFDEWMRINHPCNAFERYADDIIVHCNTYDEAQYRLNQIKERLAECGLEVHPEKTKIVYCKDARRKGKQDKIQFKFLGFDFQPRSVKSKREGKMFLSFYPAISKESRERIILEIRKTSLHRWSEKTIEEIAVLLNPRLRGWINYYGKFGKHALNRVMRKLDDRLGWYIMNKYKVGSVRKAFDMLRNIKEGQPNLFVHWKYVSHRKV
jgi:group II intron reverse transcriptase/maturase